MSRADAGGGGMQTHMLDLDSPRWLELESCSGRSRVVPDLLHRIRVRPTDEDWAEVWEQISHQWTLYPAAYAAVPHLVSLLVEQKQLRQRESLEDLARIAFPLERVSECPQDLRHDFDASLEEAGVVAIDLARSSEAPRGDHISLLCSAAALAGRTTLGRLSLDATLHTEGEVVVACPKCHNELTAVFNEAFNEVHLEVLEGYPRCRTTRVRPASPDHMPLASDFAWGLVIARAQGLRSTAWLCGLWGGGACPYCNEEFVLADCLA